MEQQKDLSLEARIMLPWAAANRPLEAEASEAILNVALGSRCLTLAPRGEVSGEWLLDRLPQALDAASEHQELSMDFSRVRDMDNLALSAVVVLLRNHAAGFKRLRLAGLPPWAVQRMESTGARDLLGRRWQGEFRDREVSFQRC